VLVESQMEVNMDWVHPTRGSQAQWLAWEEGGHRTPHRYLCQGSSASKQSMIHGICSWRTQYWSLLTMRRWSLLQLEPTCHCSKWRMLASNFRLDNTKKTTGITYPQHNQSYNGKPASEDFRRGLLAHNLFPLLGSRFLQSVCWGRFWIITGGKVRR
jgi:hypothetical protein